MLTPLLLFRAWSLVTSGILCASVLLWFFFSMCGFHEGGTTELLLSRTHAFMNQSFDTYDMINNAQQSVNEELACAKLSTCRLGSSFPQA